MVFCFHRQKKKTPFEWSESVFFMELSMGDPLSSPSPFGLQFQTPSQAKSLPTCV